MKAKFCLCFSVFSYILFNFLLLILPVNLFAEDNITLTTYYPSPYGVYKTLRLYPAADTVCDSGNPCSDKGELCFNNNDSLLLVCDGTIWSTAGGASGWQLNGNSVSSSDFIGTTDAVDWVVKTANTEMMRITSDGKVGIGTSSPASILEVVTTLAEIGNNRAAIYASTPTHAPSYMARGDIYNGSSTDSAGIYGSGTIGVKGEGSVWGVIGFGGTGADWPGVSVISVQGNGTNYDFYANGPGIDYATFSSIRWKKNIRPIDNALGKVLKLRGIYFDWDNEHGAKHDFGMIAEEVGKLFPEAVVYETDSKYATGMDYSRLTAVLVEAVKDMQKEIDFLKSEIKRLKREL